MFKKWINNFWIYGAALILAVLFLHLWQIDTLPRGLYIDESSIGINAASIAASLHDEHGAFMPTYFKAFGEYKNPIYIYTTSLLFFVFGVSEFTLRFTSFIFYAVFLFGFIILTRRLFPRNKLVIVYAILAAGFMPWLFTISRVSFEVISQPAIFVWAIYFIVQTYSKPTTTINRNTFALAAGTLIGISTYSYSTSRVLSFGVLALILGIYYYRHFWQRHVYVLLGFGLMLIPYIVFSIQNPGALTNRFNSLTYIYDAQLGLIDKAYIFISNYFSYLDLGFLLLNGDNNLRHHTGFGGEVFLTVLMLCLIGVWAISTKFIQTNSDKRLIILAGLSLAITPIAAALTEPHHSLRSVMLSLYILIFSLYGFTAIQHLPHKYLSRIMIITVMSLVIIQSALYINHYFTTFPNQSIIAFESYDFKSTLESGIAQSPSRIIVTNRANAPYAHVEFYSLLVDNPNNIPVNIQPPLATPNACIITFNFDNSIDNPKGLPINSISAHALNQPPPYTNLTCY